MQRNLLWPDSEINSPALACTPPILAPAPTRGINWATELASPLSTTFFGPTGLTSPGPSAFSVVPPSNTASLTATATVPTYPSLSPLLMCCLPKLLENLNNSTQNVLRSHMNVTAFKPIPNNEKVDLARFRVKDPNDWVIDDVVAWMLDVARRHDIPFEELNMHGFTSVTGSTMLQMSETCFLARDPVFGTLIFNEFRKSISVLEDPLLDNMIFDESDEEIPSTSSQFTSNFKPFATFDPALIQSVSTTMAPPHLPIMQNQINQLSTLQQTLMQAQSQFNPHLLTPQQTVNAVFNQSLASSLAAGLTTGLSPLNVSYLHSGLNPASPLLSTHIQQPKISPLVKYPVSISTDYEAEEDRTSGDLKIKKNKDGKPRKRSQHTKGNKLWEFIRDALKDPETCPSVVRWEDPIEGVFRIVESEKLARLWGERKNNTKMTYEKLSRAMRTYYEKQILVPVPKTGLYPKKLVYKFGPGAHGWETIKREIIHRSHSNVEIDINYLPNSGHYSVYKKVIELTA
ncbi:unnamed protein product [Caenorhabditis angaria]|uniref:ETS domain-containing protein n=1 Tax=Caenorhabditis angaria TaxID=860376 RepID=A0A9P1NBG4_9PELO|nr:unnamed protein product [Caenorhabditis angaria]